MIIRSTNSVVDTNATIVTSVLLQTMLYFLNHTSDEDPRESNTLYHVQIGDNSNMSKCYGMYGCFYLHPPWTSESRPVSLFPESPEKIEPNFLLFTPEVSNETERISLDVNDPNSIISSGIDTELPLFLIAHGYMESGNREWIQRMTRKLLNHTKCNVIVVDWNKGSAPPYTQAVANIQLIAAMTAHLLELFSKQSGPRKLDSVHFIGHSLGAHLAGYVGTIVQRDFHLKLGRITGLDPAEPHFSKTPDIIRLDPSDAEFVDVIHTDASTFIRGGLGIVQPVGHVDFYPNGGNNQPGCNKSVLHYMTIEDGSFFKAVKKYLGCNHVRSYELFMESIADSDKCPFLTISCSSYEEFTNGKCFGCNTLSERNHSRTCLKFGFHTYADYQSKFLSNELSSAILSHNQDTNKSLIFYSMTGAKAPYCRVHYRVSIKVSSSNESLIHGGEVGQVTVTVFSNKTFDSRKKNYIETDSTELTVNNGGYLKPGTVYTSVQPGFYLKIPLNVVKVQFTYQTSLVNPLTWRILTTPKIYLDYVRVDLLETKESLLVCPIHKKPLISLKPQIMYSSYC